MGNDDTSSKRATDAGFQTIPPELRPYAVPTSKNSIERGENPQLDTAMAAIEALDAIEAAARREAQVAGSVKEHVAAVAIPDAAKPSAGPAGARVEVSVPVLQGEALRKLPPRERKPWAELPENKPILASQTLIVDEDRLAEQDAEWAREKAQAEAVKKAGPASEKPLAGAGERRPKVGTVLLTALLLAAVVFGARALMTSRAPEGGSPGPAPTATLTAAAPTVQVAPPAAPLPAGVPVAPHPEGASSAAVPVLAPSATRPPERARVAPKGAGAEEDPYVDAAVKPHPVVTAPPPPQSTAPSTPSAAPPPSGSSRLFIPTPPF